MNYSFSKIFPQKPFNIGLYRFSEKVKKFGLVKKKSFKNKKNPERPTLGFFLAMLQEPHIYTYIFFGRYIIDA